MEVLRPRTSGRRKPVFATFYSFKGGVGRTMALLNAASILAGLGRRVLMIDFDLEAPGLTLFLDRQRGEGASQKQAGLVDALTEFLETPRTAALADEEPERFFRDYVATLHVPESLQRREGGRLEMIPVGQLDESYERRMYRLRQSFNDLFEQGVGRPLFERFKAVLRDADRYDYVLIDSRTGFSDEGSICTQYLADYLVVVTGLNRQNLRGTARFLAQANVAERKERVAIVASPVPMFYEEVRAERLNVARQMLAEAGLENVRIAVQIPYHPLLALDEDPRLYSLAETELFEAYQQITQALRIWAGDRPEERLQEALQFLRLEEYEEVLSILLEVGREDPKRGLDFLALASSFSFSKSSGSLTDLFEEGVNLAKQIEDEKQEIGMHMSAGIASSNYGDVSQAMSHFEKALEISQRTNFNYGIMNALDSIGYLHQLTGDLHTGIHNHNKALEISISENFKTGERNQLGNLGLAYALLGDIDIAIKYHEDALSVDIGFESKNWNVKDLGELSVAYARADRKNDALESITSALQIAHSLESPSALANAYLLEAQTLSYIQPQQALSKLNLSWKLIINHLSAFEQAQAHVLRARLLAEQECYPEAAEDAQTALDFYEPRGVDSVWSREAKAILEQAQES